MGSDVITPPKERIRGTGPGSGLGRPCSVIVMNDDHNTFEGVAMALARVLPGVDRSGVMNFATMIHNDGRARVWTGNLEVAELYWQQLRDFGLTMAPIERG